MGLELKMSTSFRPQTDGQTERVNLVIQQFLKNYVATDTIRDFVICNHHVYNWDATTSCMQLSLVFYAITMDFCPLFGCICNYGATMITFILTFG
jgi:hypothetical protein